MAAKLMTSPDTAVPVTVQVVVLLALWRNRLPVVRSDGLHIQPFGAVALLPMVMTTVQAPVVLATNEPAVAPPTNVVTVPQPVSVVNLVPIDMKLGD